jgi:hypothetical protein
MEEKVNYTENYEYKFKPQSPADIDRWNVAW